MFDKFQQIDSRTHHMPQIGRGVIKEKVLQKAKKRNMGKYGEP